MVTVTNFASFAWTVCMDDLTRDDAHGKTESMGSLTFLKTMVTLCPQIKVPLIAVCLDLLQIFILQKGFSFSQIGWNRMVLSIGNSFSRICHVPVQLSSGKSRQSSFQAIYPSHHSDISHLMMQQRLLEGSKPLLFVLCRFHRDRDRSPFYPFHS